MILRLNDLRILTAIMALGALGFLTQTAVVWLERESPVSQRAVVHWEPSLNQDANPLSEDVTMPGLDQALARPLFRSSRRPYDPSVAMVAATPQLDPALAPAEPAQVEPTIPVPAQLTIKGVVGDGARWRALIGSPEAPEGVWLEKGAEIAGWTIVLIDANAATLSQGGQRLELKLYVDNPSN
jgi:hypothetical protein